MDKRIYWIWLQEAFGYSANIYEPILYFGSAQGLYEAGENEWRSCGLFEKNRTISKLLSTDISSAAKLFDYCMKSDIKVVTPEDPFYPEPLKNLLNFPAVLYVKGDISLVNNSLTIGVVGTRKPSDYGVSAAREITLGLSKNGITVVSGGALGVDSIAHSTAIENGGKTILVMGCGIDANYLPENKSLRDEISKNGALVSEYRPSERAGYSNFPQRNRILSGISQGIVVIEAGETSGTLNIADHAKKQGKDIFAVSGDIHSANFAGSNKLISEGARVVYSANDILGFYKYGEIAKEEINIIKNDAIFDGINRYGEVKTKKIYTRKKSREVLKTNDKQVENSKEKFLNNPPEGISKNAELVYNIILGGENQLDDIVRRSALPVNKVLAALTELELSDSVKLSEGNKYLLN